MACTSMHSNESTGQYLEKRESNYITCSFFRLLLFFMGALHSAASKPSKSASQLEVLIKSIAIVPTGLHARFVHQPTKFDSVAVVRFAYLQ